MISTDIEEVFERKFVSYMFSEPFFMIQSPCILKVKRCRPGSKPSSIHNKSSSANKFASSFLNWLIALFYRYKTCYKTQTHWNEQPCHCQASNRSHLQCNPTYYPVFSLLACSFANYASNLEIAKLYLSQTVLKISNCLGDHILIYSNFG